MKKYLKEIIILVLQVAVFYLLPLCGGPTDILGVIFLLFVGTFILGILWGLLVKEKYKYFYPIIVALIFIPSIFIYYNSSALIHSLWYLIISLVGTLLGSGIAFTSKGRK